MDDSRAARLVGASLRCYPARWRRRHGEEAAELASLLIRDGRPAGSVAWSYLAGAAREWLTPRPSRRVRALAGALLAAACLLGVSAGLLASAGPARAAASTSQPHGHPQCRPGSPGPVPGLLAAPGLLPAPSRAHVTIQGGGHGRSC
jgi:hypothetical protein